MNPNELRKQKAKIVSDAKLLTDKAKAGQRDLNADEGVLVDKAIADAEALDAQIAEAEKAEQRTAKIDAQYQALGQSTGAESRGRVQPTTNKPGEVKESRVEQRDRELATARRYGMLRNFPNTPEGYWKAYRFGQWCIAAASRAFGGGARARQYCKDNGLAHMTDADFEQRTQTEGTNSAGGYLVPEEFSNDLIDLRAQYGIARQVCKQIPMKGDTHSRPRVTGGLTAYFVGEAGAGTTSSKAWDRVNLRAKKLMALTVYSSEINEDAVINIGDDLAGEIAKAFAKLEDQCLRLSPGVHKPVDLPTVP
jgi:HK97 family phage major capsid protein